MIFIDANIFMYAAGRASPQRSPCQEVLRRLVMGQPEEPACTSTEVLQEILHRYRSIGSPALGFRLFDSVLQLGLMILPVEVAAMRHARQILEEHPDLSTRDAVHAGVIRSTGFARVLSYDRGFSTLAWLQRLEPEALL
ncbi:type II toxin-antitoxin system VapC family toxin [Myxococcota bacterium]